MKNLFGRRRSREPGWLAMSMQAGELAFAHGVSTAGKCRVTRCGTRALADQSAKEFEHLAKQLDLERYQCLTVLPATDYQLLLVDAPNVPAIELKSAVRWRLKDMLDYHVDDATVDVLDIPMEGAASARGHSMYAVAARNETIARCITRFTEAQVPLSVIDIVETAQRNISALFEPPARGVGMIYLGARQALLTVNFRGELYLARRIDVGAEQLADTARDREEARNRILLELQRSLDHLDRQFPFVTMGRLLVAPEPSETGLAAYLAANLDLPVEQARLADVVEFGPDAELAGDSAWRLFHVIGAALRNETKAL
jgi:MSHA biogenesis protein MshI